ncbi:aminoacyl-tRNA hydrolase [soil metagenome]
MLRRLRRASIDETEGGRLVVVGLGNPGSRYERTRHNAGRMALALLLERSAVRLKRHKSGCMVAEVSFAGHPVVLAHPLTHMNDSGRPVGELMRWYKSAPERVIVLHDELDIPFGQVRVKRDGGIAGHNGLRSLAAHLASRDFGRVRIGISRPSGSRSSVDWVLSEFSVAERKELPLVLERAADAAESIAERGFEASMNEFNTRTE